MPKRTRGSTRPGQRARVQRQAPRAAASSSVVARPPSSLTREEEARAAELEAQIVAEERAADNALRRSRDRSRQVEPAGRVREGGPLAARASEEYAYVRRDVIRIARIGAALVAILAVLFVLIDVTHVITL
ncbi:MAG TPA: hypothetical protein VGC90_07245 [Candidatus Limnocylindrales bacterium]|jgi:hypothetical protein